MKLWPATRHEYFNGTSDHKMMMVTISQVEKGRKPFRLFNSWLEDPEFINMAKQGLSKKIRGTGLFKIQEKLKVFKALTKEWLGTKGNFDKQVTTARADLDLAIQALEDFPSYIPL